jgi:hypothetical protein
MTLRISLLVAAILALVPLQGALAQSNGADPTEIARHCIHVIHAQTARAVGGIEETTDATLHQIRRLAASGASDREIIAAGQAGAARVTRISETATDAIQSTTRRCVAALVAAGADRRLIARVLSASDNAQARIAVSAERAHTAIRSAVGHAIG